MFAQSETLSSVLVLFFVGLCSALTTQQYYELISAYFGFRSVSVVTHLTCFSLAENVELSLRLSELPIQSRFITSFNNLRQIVDTPNTTQQGFIVNESCDSIDEVFAQQDHLILFKNNNLWLFVNGNSYTAIESQEAIEHRFSSLGVYPISDVIYAQKLDESNEVAWKLFDVYKIATNYPLEITHFADVLEKDPESQSLFLNVTKISLNSNPLRDNLKGLKLVCGLVIAYPEKFTYMDNPDDDHIDIFTKSTWPVVKNLHENLNMSCAVKQTDSYGWLKNGTFDGAMGLFQKKKINALSHGTNMRADRLPYVEFTGEIFAISTPFLFRQPPLSAISNIFVLPLSLSVWVCLVVTILVIIAAMMTQQTHSLLKHRLFPLDIATFVWGAVCQQSSVLVITTTSGRVTVLTTFLAMLALFTSYSASIVALLQTSSQSIRTIEDLVASPLQMGIQEAGYNRFNYIHENRSALNEVYVKRIQPLGSKGWIYDTVKGIERARTELFALQVESTTAYKVIDRTYRESEKCSLSEIHLLRLPVTTMTVERNSPYKEIFKRRLRWQRENGLMNRVKRRWLPSKPVCERGIRQVRTVGMPEIRPALYVLFLGLVTSLTICLSESLYHRATCAKRKQKECNE